MDSPGDMSNIYVMYTAAVKKEKLPEYDWVCDVVGIEQAKITMPTDSLRFYLEEISKYPVFKESVRHLYLSVLTLPLFKSVSTIQLLRRSNTIDNTFHLIGLTNSNTTVIFGVIHRRPLTSIDI